MYGAPFATFTFKALPRIAEAAVKTPWRFFLPMAMVNGLEEAAREAFHDTTKNAEGKAALREEWMKGKMFGFSNFPRVPIMDDFGREYYLDLTYILPWGDLAQSGGTGPIPGSLMPMTHPLTSQVWQQVANYNLFTKQELVKKSNLEGKDLSGKILQQLKDRGTFAGKSLLPTPLVDSIRIMAGDVGAPDYRGREKPTGIILADALAGLKMYPVDYADQMRRQISQLDPKRGKVAQEIRGRIKANTIRAEVMEQSGRDGSRYRDLIQEDIGQLEGLAKELKEFGQLYTEAVSK
jgi:hypothetical protein